MTNRALLFSLVMADCESPWVEGCVGTWYTEFGDSIIQTEDGFSLYVYFEIYNHLGIRVPTCDFLGTFESLIEAKTVYKLTLDKLAV